MSETERPKCEIPECSIKADDYKCFREEPTGFEQLKQINLIIGKNNAGKSALVDLVEYACPAKGIHEAPCRTINDLTEIDATPLTIIEPFDSTKFKRLLDESIKTTGTPTEVMFPSLNKDPHELGLEGKTFAWKRSNISENRKSELTTELEAKLRDLDFYPEADPHAIFHNTINAFYTLPFKEHYLFRLIADRDLQPGIKPNNTHGAETHPIPVVKSNGEGFSLLYELFEKQDPYIHHDALELVKNSLQEIYGRDGKFSVLRVMIHFKNPEKKTGPMLEVALRESAKGNYIRIADSGSGLKTILLTLATLHMLPLMTGAKYAKTIFCFEELENNLHPSVQRRLFIYLLDFTRENGCMLFLTTHSNIAIDIFSKCSNEEAQILHVTHDGTRAAVAAIAPEKLGHVLDDLGYQASDILQSNYLVWVEGPSDRIYIKYVLQKDHNLEEGVHYSIMFYGGRLLSHLDFDGTSEWDEEAVQELIDLAKINRNSAIVLDSDKDSEESDINDTKKRLIAAFTDGENNKCFAWLTAGREIENYIDSTDFKVAVDEVHKDVDWNSITLDQYSQRTVRKEKNGKKTYIDKVKVARKLCKTGDLNLELDWNNQIQTLANNIRTANGM